MILSVHVLASMRLKLICLNGNRLSMKKRTQPVKWTIGMVGKYIELPDAYKSVNEALKHAGLKKSSERDYQVR